MLFTFLDKIVVKSLLSLISKNHLAHFVHSAPLPSESSSGDLFPTHANDPRNLEPSTSGMALAGPSTSGFSLTGPSASGMVLAGPSVSGMSLTGPSTTGLAPPGSSASSMPGMALEGGESLPGLTLGGGDSLPGELTLGDGEPLPPEIMALLAKMSSDGGEEMVEEKSLQQYKAENKESLKSKGKQQ